MDGEHPRAELVESAIAIEDVLDVWRAHARIAERSNDIADFGLHRQEVFDEHRRARRGIDFEIFVETIGIEVVERYIDDGFGEDGIDGIERCSVIAPNPSHQSLDLFGIVANVFRSRFAQKDAPRHDIFEIEGVFEPGHVVEIVVGSQAQKDDHVPAMKSDFVAEIDGNDPACVDIRIEAFGDIGKSTAFHHDDKCLFVIHLTKIRCHFSYCFHVYSHVVTSIA